MKLEILTPDQTIYEGDVNGVRLPGVEGSFEVLNNHAPIISNLEGGNIRVKEEAGETKFFNVGPGFVEVLNNKIVVLV